MRADVRMRCFLPRHSPFWAEKKTPSKHSCDSEAELGSSGLSRLSAGIKHKAGLAKFPRAKPRCWKEVRSSPPAERIPAGAGLRCPHPRAQSGSAQATALLCPAFAPRSPPAAGGSAGRSERMDRQVRGFRATAATSPAASACPSFSRDVPHSHGALG